jgi:putative NADH-flavin reductase
MKIIVIGASRGIGRQTVRVALEKGHTVTAFSRHPESLVREHAGLNSRLRLEAGDVLDAKAVQKAIRGQDIVICALGLPSLQAMGPPFAQRSYVLSTGTQNILEAMAANDVKRLLCVTAIGAGNSVEQCTVLTRMVLRRGLKWLFKEKDRQEELIKNSPLEWTIVRPTALTNGRAKGAMTGEHLHSGVLTQVSRADVATMMVNSIDQPESYGKALVVSYPPRFGDSFRWVAGYFGMG